jgi:hypothetical protein
MLNDIAQAAAAHRRLLKTLPSRGQARAGLKRLLRNLERTEREWKRVYSWALSFDGLRQDELSEVWPALTAQLGSRGEMYARVLLGQGNVPMAGDIATWPRFAAQLADARAMVERRLKMLKGRGRHAKQAVLGQPSVELVIACRLVDLSIGIRDPENVSAWNRWRYSLRQARSERTRQRCRLT